MGCVCAKCVYSFLAGGGVCVTGTGMGQCACGILIANEDSSIWALDGPSTMQCSSLYLETPSRSPTGRHSSPGHYGR